MIFRFFNIYLPASGFFIDDNSLLFSFLTPTFVHVFSVSVVEVFLKRRVLGSTGGWLHILSEGIVGKELLLSDHFGLVKLSGEEIIIGINEMLRTEFIFIEIEAFSHLLYLGFAVLGQLVDLIISGCGGDNVEVVVVLHPVQSGGGAGSGGGLPHVTLRRLPLGEKQPMFSLISCGSCGGGLDLLYCHSHLLVSSLHFWFL